MKSPDAPHQQRLFMLMLLILYVFSPTLFNWMISSDGAWYRPFLVWFGVVVAAAIYHARKS